MLEIKQLQEILKNLLKYSKETEWIEFKVNNKNYNPNSKSKRHAKYIPFWA